MPEGDTIHRTALRLGRALDGKPLVAFAAPRLAHPGPEPGTLVSDVVAVCVRTPVVELLDVAALERHPALRQLGPDLAVPGVDLDAAVARVGRMVVRGTTVGDALLDQRPACGIGNVVMQEACFLAGIDPRTPIERVGEHTRRTLYAAAARILQHNVHTTRRTTVPDAPTGSLWVYDRAGRGCRRCGTTIEVGRPGRDARPTWWCPTCQGMP